MSDDEEDDKVVLSDASSEPAKPVTKSTKKNKGKKGKNRFVVAKLYILIETQIKHTSFGKDPCTLWYKQTLGTHIYCIFVQ